MLHPTPQCSIASSHIQAIRLFLAGHEWLEQFKWAAIAAVAIGLPTSLLRALAGLRRFLLDINTLMTVAVAGEGAVEHRQAGLKLGLWA